MRLGFIATYAAVVCLVAAVGWWAYGGPAAGIAVSALAGSTLLTGRALVAGMRPNGGGVRA